MSSLGIYFGPKVIGITETKGKKVAQNAKIPVSVLSPGELEEKVPDDVKMVALIKEELRKHVIEAKDASISLSGKDLVVRTFEMPALPPSELANAVNFEARKYIPFKTEDLITDFHFKTDKKARRHLVLFAGIKRDVLQKYSSVISQLGIKVNNLEYSGFSLLRFLKSTGLGLKGVSCLVCIDGEEEDEGIVMVLEDGFPLFTRDISLSGGGAAYSGAQPAAVKDGAADTEKLKSEIRISLDYFHRKFTAKKIAKVYFVSPGERRADLESFAAEAGLSAQFIDVAKYTGKEAPFSLSFVKSYGAAVFNKVNTGLRVKFTITRIKERPPQNKGLNLELKEIASLLSGVRINVKSVILGLLICLAVFGIGIYRMLPLRKELEAIKARETQAAGVNAQSSNQVLTGVADTYRKKVSTMDKLVKEQLYLTEVLDAIPRLVREGMWLVDFSFEKQGEGAVLILGGVVDLSDSNREFDSVNEFLSKLKQSPVFIKYFAEIKIISSEVSQIEQEAITRFVISCRSKKGS
ncbi:pilus assembly protein PilM [Candidatus Omnitrophota bacterium]